MKKWTLGTINLPDFLLKDIKKKKSNNFVDGEVFTGAKENQCATLFISLFLWSY